MALPELEGFNLAGGTALALQIGHRLSIDLDFFGAVDFDPTEVLDILSQSTTPVIMSQSRNILILNIEGVKVDFVNYRYPLLHPPNQIDGLRLLASPDIAAGTK